MLFLLCFSRPLEGINSFVVPQGDVSVFSGGSSVESLYSDCFASGWPFADPAGCLFLLTMMC